MNSFVSHRCGQTVWTFTWTARIACGWSTLVRSDLPPILSSLKRGRQLKRWTLSIPYIYNRICCLSCLCACLSLSPPNLSCFSTPTLLGYITHSCTHQWGLLSFEFFLPLHHSRRALTRLLEVPSRRGRRGHCKTWMSLSRCAAVLAKGKRTAERMTHLALKMRDDEKKDSSSDCC